MLYNTADMERGGAGDGDTVAILEGTQLCATRQLRDLLPTLGGVSALLPPLAQLGAGGPPCMLNVLRPIYTSCMGYGCCEIIQDQVGSPVTSVCWTAKTAWHLLDA